MELEYLIKSFEFEFAKYEIAFIMECHTPNVGPLDKYLNLIKTLGVTRTDRDRPKKILRGGD